MRARARLPLSRSNRLCFTLALVLGACGGGTPEAERPAPEPPGEAAAEPEEAASDSPESAPPPLDAAALEKHFELIRSLGSMIAFSGRCSLQALQYSKFKGPRDMLYMLVGVFPENASGPGPMCKVDIFSPTDAPRLQWHVSLAATGKDGKVQSKRNRPEKYRHPTEDEQHQLEAVLKAAAAARTRGFTVPVAIRAEISWLVYLMDFSLDETKLSLGPHYRVVVTDGGATKVELLSSGDLVDLAPGGKRLDVIKLQFDEDLPNESHVFMSAMSGTALIVATPNGNNWQIARGKIERVE